MRAIQLPWYDQVDHPVRRAHWMRWVAIILALLVLLACAGPAGGIAAIFAAA